MINKVIIKIIILLLLLAGLTVLFARQDVVMWVKLNDETIIRNGQRLSAVIFTDNGALHTIQAETTYRSLYEYNIKIPNDIWRDMSSIRLEFGQVRRGDHIYIDTISIEHLLFKYRNPDNSFILNNIYDIASSELTISEGNLIDIEVLATRAHTPAMNTEGPSFSIPAEVLQVPGTIGTAYILSVAAVALLWGFIFFIIPVKIYKRILAKLKEAIIIVKAFSFVDAAIALFGVSALIFYHYADSIPYLYNDFLYLLLSAVTILLIIIKIANKRECGNTDTILSEEHKIITDNNTDKWLPYIVLLVLGSIIYIPAIFPNPYYFNDENIVIGAAEDYLRYSNYDNYDRAWPHTWLVAQAVKLLGESTVSTRFVSALFGISFIISAYYIINDITKKRQIASISAVLLLCNPSLISIFTNVRMYAVMMPASLWMFYCIYKTLHCEIAYKNDNALTRFIQKHFNFHFGYAAAAIFLMWFNFEIHGNSMIIPLCAIIYVFILALIKRERKYIYLSIIGAGVVILSALIITDNFYVPVMSEMLWYMLTYIGSGARNYIYFWDNIKIPLGPALGIFFPAVSIITYKSNTKKYHFLLYPALLYIITVLFFVFVAERYYEYVYMSFLAPITIFLISTGIYALMEKIDIPTRFAISVIIVTAAILQISSMFSYIYIDKPERSKFDRPFAIISNDAKVEQLDGVLLHATNARRFWTYIENSNSLGYPSSSGYQIDWMLERAYKPVIYFMSEHEKMFRLTEPTRLFLETATDFIADIDNTIIRKYHFIESEFVDTDTNEYNDRFCISGILWEDDTAYVDCKIRPTGEFINAIFFAIEITEQGLMQSATHRYQIFMPDYYDENGEIKFTLPIRPKTEEYSENITFSILQQAYIYYGKNAAVIIEIT